MPSDARIEQALATFAPAIERYCSTVAATAEDVRGALTAHRADTRGRVAQLQEELGPFGAGHIDPARLANVLGDKETIDPRSLEHLERAFETLQVVSGWRADLFHITLPAGGDLFSAVSLQLAEIGRAFGAARVAAVARAGASATDVFDAGLLGAFPFTEWTSAERKLAPPLVVSLQGSDLRAGALSPFLDGAQKIVLLVEGDCAPAPLVRLITPSTFVMQTHDVKMLESIATWPGAAVAAVLPATTAQFVHDPSAGPEVWQRVQIAALPKERPARLGGLSPTQQLDELQQLEALAFHPETGAAPASEPRVTPDPADRLAAWLLQQADLTGAAGAD